MCHKVGGPERAMPPMNNFSPESPTGTNNRTANPLEVEDTIEGLRAKKVAKPDPDIAERVAGIVNDFLDKVRKSNPTPEEPRRAVTPR